MQGTALYPPRSDDRPIYCQYFIFLQCGIVIQQVSIHSLELIWGYNFRTSIIGGFRFTYKINTCGQDCHI